MPSAMCVCLLANLCETSIQVKCFCQRGSKRRKATKVNTDNRGKVGDNENMPNDAITKQPRMAIKKLPETLVHSTSSIVTETIRTQWWCLKL